MRWWISSRTNLNGRFFASDTCACTIGPSADTSQFGRLALSHNSLTTFPARFSECTLLRYLNVRQNKIREFPLAVSDPFFF